MDNYKKAMNVMDDLRVTMKKLHNKENKPFRKVEFHALLIILEFKSITMQKLGEELGVTKSRVTAIISKLTDKGFVEQVSDTKDKRKKLLQLTKVGEEYMVSERAKYEEWFKQLWDKFTLEEQINWIHLIAKINRVIKGDLEEEE
ncbi:transcriptional regulator, MarR family [Gemella bergeri ATCC 700627]|uniref:Transcriptional regulator, MarR family n=1 Tax=Gemella bergeri ATCC 700627 TaxID=1321820 RepID=U2Q067_9BACL|nr:MarR family transcriptional regulator [Gemella bergeri]ERK56155.1 transcriptional regulator, MarR family [Gemella bergeri ATCC 700627]